MSSDEIQIKPVDPAAHTMSTLSHSFLRASDIGARTVTAKIESVERIEFPGKKPGEVDGANLVRFVGAKLPWVVKKTNTVCINGMFGDTFADWIGKSVTIRVETVRLGPEVVPAIRVVGSPDIKSPITVKIPAGRGTANRVLTPTAAAAATTKEP